MTNEKAVLDKVDFQGKGNNTEASQRLFSAFHQHETAFEDLANVSQNMLDLSTILTTLKKLRVHENQVDPVNFCSRAHRPVGTEISNKQDGSTCKLIYTLAKFLNLVGITLVSY